MSEGDRPPISRRDALKFTGLVATHTAAAGIGAAIDRAISPKPEAKPEGDIFVIQSNTLKREGVPITAIFELSGKRAEVLANRELLENAQKSGELSRIAVASTNIATLLLDRLQREGSLDAERSAQFAKLMETFENEAGRIFGYPKLTDNRSSKV